MLIINYLENRFLSEAVDDYIGKSVYALKGDFLFRFATVHSENLCEVILYFTLFEVFFTDTLFFFFHIDLIHSVYSVMYESILMVGAVSNEIIFVTVVDKCPRAYVVNFSLMSRLSSLIDAV